MDKRTNTLLVSEEGEGERLDRFLAEALPHYAREYFKTLIQEGLVQVNDQVVTKPALTLKEGQVLQVTFPSLKPLDLTPQDLSLEVVFEDKALLVVNKPSGMLTHPSGREHHGTLVNALLYHCQDQLSGINGVERPGIVHRLDRETSGLLMVAKTDQVHRALQEQLQDRTAKRTYQAIVQGIMSQETGMVDAPMGRHPKHRERMAVLPQGREARTQWQVIETLGEKFSILSLNLETGRTHQIRVHMAHIGHPIFADPLYGSGLEKVLKYPSEGQILQAVQLAFTHPLTHDRLTFTCPADTKYRQARAFLGEC